MNLSIDKEIELRQLRLSDAENIFVTINNQRAYLGKWLPFVEFTKELKDTKAFILSLINAPKTTFEYVFTIRQNEQIIGLIGFKSTDHTNKKTEIGYWLSEDAQGQGIVTKSVQQLCKFAFGELGMNRIQIKCALENTASTNIPKKLDFKLEGTERAGELLSGGIYTDLLVFSKLKED